MEAYHANWIGYSLASMPHHPVYYQSCLAPTANSSLSVNSIQGGWLGAVWCNTVPVAFAGCLQMPSELDLIRIRGHAFRGAACSRNALHDTQHTQLCSVPLGQALYRNWSCDVRKNVRKKEMSMPPGIGDRSLCSQRAM